MTQEQLADYLGLSRQSISQWESGQVQDIKRANIEQLATRFGVSITDLYDDGIEITPDGVPIRKTNNASSIEPVRISNQVYNIYCIYRKKPNARTILTNCVFLALLLGIAIWSTLMSFRNDANFPLLLASIFTYALFIICLITMLSKIVSYRKALVGYLTPEKLHFDCYDGKIESAIDIALENIVAIQTTKDESPRRKKGQISIKTTERIDPYTFSAIIEDPESLISVFGQFKSGNPSHH